MIYLASSWKNPFVGSIADCLYQSAIPSYNFKDGGFHWSEVNSEYASTHLTFTTYIGMLDHPRAQEGFDRDFDHLKVADGLILILPCGRSAHLELGYAVGVDIPTAIYFKHEPAIQAELMYKMVNLLTDDIDTLMQWSNSVFMDGERERHRKGVLNAIDELS